MDESYLAWLRLIPGVTAELARRIAQRYPDPELLKGASPEDLAAILGISEDLASRVLELVRTAAKSDESWYKDEPSLYLCPECGSFVGKGATACPFCGVIFEEGGALEEAPAPVEELLTSEAGETKICTKCGAFIGPKETACAMCGTTYPAARLAELPAVDTRPVREAELSLCPYCGAFLSEGAQSCAICGRPVAQEERIAGLTGKGVSKDFLSRWQKAAAPEPALPPSLDEELAHCDRLLESDPANERAWVRKGRILIELRRTAEAVECFDRAAQLNPERDESYKLEVLGALEPTDWSVLPARWAGEVEATRPAREAEAPLPEKGPAEAPPLPVTDTAAIRRALVYYDRLLEADRSLRIAWMTKGELLERLGRADEAETCFRRAAELSVAEQEAGRTALAGLEARGPGRPRPGPAIAPPGRTNGRVNGLVNGRRGRTNGLTNGLRGRTNGLVNGLRGRTNGLTNGMRGRTNGLVNGMGAVNGLAYGVGPVNGLVNGLVMGKGRTNGLVNGTGFTNGRTGRFPRPTVSTRATWSRSLGGIAAVVLFIVLAPILASVFTTTPAPTGIAIDGSFGDWGGVSVQYANSPDHRTTNPDVNLLAYKVSAEPDRLDVYAHVEGAAFRGSGNGADTLVALIDSDGRADTGYDAGILGADMAVQLVGWDSVIREATLLQFSPTANRGDWFGFEAVGTVPAAARGPEVEFSVDVAQAASSRLLLAAVDGVGRKDVADAVVVPGSPALSVRESTIAPDVIQFANDVGVFRLDLLPEGLPVPLTQIVVAKLGSLPDSAAVLTLFRDNGDGAFTPSDTAVATAPISQTRTSFSVPTTLSSPTTYFVAASFTALPANATFGLALDNVAAAGVVTIASRDLTLSYLTSAPAPTVDGAFADWEGVAVSPDPAGDVRNQSAVATLVNANVDLTEVASAPGANATFYFRVDGTMLGGVDVPNLRARSPAPSPPDSDRDGVPNNVEIALGPVLPYDFDNDNVSDADSNRDADGDGATDYPSGPDLWLNTTIPAWYPQPYAGRNESVYIGPVAPRKLEGVDSAIAYVDADNSSGTGLFATFGGSTYGLDWAVVVMGRYGTIASSALYRYRAGPAIPWEFVQDVPASADAACLEVSAPGSVLNLSAGYRTVYYAADWRASYDVGLPVPPGRSPAPRIGTRTPAGDNVVINEVSPQPNPEWVELANPTSGSIGLTGWVLQRQKGNKWETFYTFGSVTIGAWGSGTEYLSIAPPANSLPNGQTAIRLVDAAGSAVDATTYGGTGSGESWARFKNPTTGKPMDSDSDASDFYVSSYPSRGAPNDRHRPTIVVAKTANKATAAPGDEITYTLYYNNTDTGRANHVWLNDTLPAQVTFVSSSVAPSGSSGQTYYWYFTNVDPSTNNQLTITVKVNDGTGNMVSLVNKAVLEYTDQLNRKLTGSTAWRNVTVWRPVIKVAKIGDKSTALPGDTIVYTIYYNNTGFASAAHVWINDTLPNDVTFQSSSVPPAGSSGQTYRWYFANVGVGVHSFTITVTVNAGATSQLLVNWVFLNYTSQNGYKLEQSSASFTTSIPEFSDLALVAVVPLVILGIRRLRRRRDE